MITLNNIKIFYGPNPYAQTSVIVADLYIEKQFYKQATEAGKHLMSLFPKWISQKLNTNTESDKFVATIIAQWALGALNEVQGAIYDSGAAFREENTYLWVGFHNPRLSIKALELALHTLRLCMKKKDCSKQSLRSPLASFWQQCKQHHPSESIKILMKEAEELNIPTLPLMPGYPYWQFGWGEKSKIFFDTVTNDDGYIGTHISYLKTDNKAFFKSLGLPYPKGIVINTLKELEYAAKTVGFPSVTKPIRGAQGKGITASIQNFEELKNGFIHAKRSRQEDIPILIEKFIHGDDHRIMAIDGKFFATLRRKPSCVVGNGQNTILELIEVLNDIRKKDNLLKPIAINEDLTAHLNKQKVSLRDILPNKKIITLSSTANYSSGGMVEDLTEETHPHIIQLAESIAQVSGISIIGIDYITTDISRSYKEVEGGFTEFNNFPSPDLLKFLKKRSGTVATILGDKPKRIPLHIVVVNDSELTTAQEWLHANMHRHEIGWVCGKNTVIGNVPLQVKYSKDWSMIHTLLRQKMLKSVLIVCDIKEILQKGLPVDKADYISLYNVKIPTHWLPVFKASTSNLKEFKDLNTLFSFSLDILSK